MYLEYLPGLLRDVRLGPQLEEPPGERPGRLEVLQLEEHVARRAQRQDLEIQNMTI